MNQTLNQKIEKLFKTARYIECKNMQKRVDMLTYVIESYGKRLLGSTPSIKSDKESRIIVKIKKCAWDECDREAMRKGFDVLGYDCKESESERELTYTFA